MMKNRISLAVALSLLLALISVNLYAQDALDVVVTGENINIGSRNVLEAVDSHGVSYKGNAIGFRNMLHSVHSLAVGINDTIGSNSSGAVSLGASNYIQGEAAMAFGRSVKVTGNDNIGIGHHIRVNGLSCGMVIGSGIEGILGADAYLANDSSNCLMVGFNSTKPTLFVGASPNDYGQGILNKTGRVAIGNVMPLAKLHIRSDIGEDAGLILEPGDSTEDSTYIRIHDAQHGISVGHHRGMLITSGENNPLHVVSNNFKVDESFLGFGSSTNRSFTFCTAYNPSIGFNARQSNGHYIRGHGSSYVMEFSNASFKLRTAAYQYPISDTISNWVDALTIGINGAVTLNGKVGVNTENTYNNYALAVNGGILATEVHILLVENWPDYVFNEDYPLMSLCELKQFIDQHHHLPEIPSEKDIEEKGNDLGEMQNMLLKKIEELTLYILQQEERISQLERELNLNHR